eukprot:m.462447 g.462447  ORF g.462447 m.462447 type:complete len:104 (+) comp22657_c0_seq1:1490-1801(+)
MSQSGSRHLCGGGEKVAERNNSTLNLAPTMEATSTTARWVAVVTRTMQEHEFRRGTQMHDRNDPVWTHYLLQLIVVVLVQRRQMFHSSIRPSVKSTCAANSSL